MNAACRFFPLFLFVGMHCPLQALLVEIGIRNCYDSDIFVTYRMSAESQRLCVRRIVADHKELIHVALPDDALVSSVLPELLIDFKISSGTMSWQITEAFTAFIGRTANKYHEFTLYVYSAVNGRMAVNWRRNRFAGDFSTVPAPSKGKKVRFAAYNMAYEFEGKNRSVKMKK